jgi:hypothetical protein
VRLGIVVAYLAAVLLFAGGGYWYWQHRFVLPRRDMMISRTRDDLSGLRVDIENACGDAVFRRFVGTGIVANLTDLPAVSPAFRDHLNDRFGHPFHLKLSPRGSPTNGILIYDELIWSDGPNRLNEAGRGDDISLKDFFECLAK